MTLPKSCLQLCSLLLLGLIHIATRCDARAVNVSNTWTMPQEGLNVFYRFFRDRISWFEADAVCQFHHANLVTVDNSFQFDATRDLLRELDVNDIVWIGLMRPQSSDRFMWSNSRPLVTDTGYWAEALPLMEAPLCAVIDPIRDYRWHALRCGGPETASFLCEMPVPSWADSCILKDMPNLTMQYMADTASIELIRNCAEEGLLRYTCKGKQDRDHAVRELICPRERLEAQRINDITNSHFKSLQIINSIRTDNNENNDIELLPLGQNYGANNDFPEEVQTEKNTVQRLIEQFNVDELMQADEPASNVGYKIPGEIPKPVKKAAKKVVVSEEYLKKSKAQKYAEAAEVKPKRLQQMLILEDMMMGDQPHGEHEMVEENNDEVSNEIMEPLPHKKKILPQDLKTMPTITEMPEFKQVKESVESTESVEKAEKQKAEAKEYLSLTTIKAATTITTPATTTTTSTPAVTTTITTATSTTTIPSTTTQTAASATTTETPAAILNSELTTVSPSIVIVSTAAPVAADVAATLTSPAAASPAATIGHPMHPQQPRSNIITEETQHPHIKESADNSHFIPPMLLVKSHYVPPSKHDHAGEHHERAGEHHDHAGEHHAILEEGNERHHDVTENMSSMLAATTTNAVDNLESTIYAETSKPEHNVDVAAAATAITDDISEITAAATAGSTTETNVATTTSAPPTTTTAKPATFTTVPTTTTEQIATTTTSTEPAKIVELTETHAKIIMADMKLSIVEDDSKRTDNDNNNNKTSDNDKLAAATTATTTTTTVASTTSDKMNAALKEECFNEEHTQYSNADKQQPVATTAEHITKRKMLHNEDILATTMAAAIKATTPKEELTKISSEMQEEERQETSMVTTEATAPAAIITTAATTIMPASTSTTTTTKTYVDSTTVHIPVRRTVIIEQHQPKQQHHQHHHKAATTEEPEITTHNFLKDETEAPFKPNRHRELTKPETVSYFKKILG